jgi:GNAT superfamily N-acetyltransferase
MQAMVFERFTDQARSVIVIAQERARAFGHNSIDSGHLLLGLYGQPVVGEFLSSSGVPLAVAESHQMSLRTPKRRRIEGHIPFSSDAKEAIQRAVSESYTRRSLVVDQRHLLLGIASAGGTGAVILTMQDITRDRLLELWRSVRVVRTRPMSDEEYPTWRAQHVADYAEDMARNAGVDAATLMEQSEREQSELLPEGLRTPGHRLVIAEDPATGQQVGWLWLGDRKSDAGHVAWVYDIVVEESVRGGGYGRAILAQAEVLAREMGLNRIELNVFADNGAARALYESSGYHETARQMAKDL